MQTIFSRVHLNMKSLWKLSGFLIAAATAEMLLPALMATMIDKGVGQNHPHFIFIIACAMAVMALASWASNAAATRISAAISTKFGADLRREVFHQVQSFSEAETDRFGTASLVSRTTSDITNIQMFFTMILRLGVMAPLMAIAGLVLSAATGGEVSAVLTIAIPLLLLCSAVILLLSARYSMKMRRLIDTINRLFLESLEGVRVIRAFNRQNYEQRRFESVNHQYTATSIAASRLTGLLMPLIQVIFGMSTAAVLALGAWYVSSGQMEVGALIANTQYISMILMSIILLAAVIMMFPTTWACMKRIGEVLNTSGSVADGTMRVSQKTAAGTIEFQNVTFAYPGASDAVLENISFSAGPGEITAVIGKTGCGKSSLLKMAGRLYDPVSGHVLIDGIDVREYRLDDLRSLIGYVPQKNVLFSGDIASNLNFGQPHGQEEDWKEATELACARDFVEKKEGGFHAPVAQGGTNFSGGQRQRLAIARALMKKPEILILDDSFSALDMKTDRQLRTRLKHRMNTASILLAAQRISSVLDADRILVLDEGKLAGMGTHAELLESCEIYREMVRLQLGENAQKNEKSSQHDSRKEKKTDPSELAPQKEGESHETKTTDR